MKPFLFILTLCLLIAGAASAQMLLIGGGGPVAGGSTPVGSPCASVCLVTDIL